TTPADLKAQLRRLWERGELLRAGPEARIEFPLRLPLKTPTSAELTAQFEAVRAWVAELAAFAPVRLDWRDVGHRVLGAQRVPRAAWVDDRETALALIGKRAEAARYDALRALLGSRQPLLLPWLARRPLQALMLADEFERLLGVVEWLARNPRPGVYLRQVDVPGVHSKFIELHRHVLAEWLDCVLPSEAVCAEYSGSARFAERYGFLAKPVRIRFR